MSDGQQKVVASPERRRSTFGLFLVCNLLFTFVLFPLVEIVAAFVFWSEKGGFDLVTAILALSHLAGLSIGLMVYGKVRGFIAPLIVSMAFVFLSTRHEVEMFDSSPFSDGVGAPAHQRWGVNGYLRVYDDPEGPFGPSYFDPGAVFIGVELSVLLTVLLGIVRMWVLAIARRFQRALQIEDEVSI